MKLSNEFATVIELMLTRLESRQGAVFSIPSAIVSPETATVDEQEALDAAGFYWVDNETYTGYMYDLNKQEFSNS